MTFPSESNFPSASFLLTWYSVFKNGWPQYRDPRDWFWLAGNRNFEPDKIFLTLRFFVDLDETDQLMLKVNSIIYSIFLNFKVWKNILSFDSGRYLQKICDQKFSFRPENFDLPQAILKYRALGWGANHSLVSHFYDLDLPLSQDNPKI